jgi:phosphomannomutase/phosphoglucomutase
VINPNIFREYDIRGLADRELTDEAASLIARAFGSKIREEGGRIVVLARDVRESSPRLEAAWAHGMASCGLEVVRIGVAPTPVLYFAVATLPGDGGVVITGSHNPIEYNGFKLQKGTESLHGEGIQEIGRRAQEGRFVQGEGKLIDRSMLQAYQSMVLDRCRPQRPLKMVVDAGNGTAGPVAVPILEKLGHTVVQLYCEPDGRFPNHQPDPTVEAYMTDLKARVAAERADLGIGYDGDADRLGVVDETGRLLYGDQLLALFARDVLERVPGAPIVFDVKCSQGLEEDIRAHGGRPIMWKTGHSLTKAKMKEEHAPLAGEMSGHMFFQEGFFGHDDAIYGSARFSAILSRAPRPLSALLASLPHYFNSPEVRVECADDAKFRIVREAGEIFARGHQVIDIDGARVLFEDGWGLVRASNTQPVLVLRFEGKSQEALKRIEREFRSVLGRYPEVIWP